MSGYLPMLALCGLVGCGGAQGPQLGARLPAPLTETQAHLVIEQALSSANVLSTQDQPATLTQVGPYTVDYVFSDPRFGIEWLSQDDRAAHPAATWPPHAPDGPLAAMEGTLGQKTLHVLVLDERAYLYESNSHWVQRGADGIDSVEERLRGDVEEFLRYVAAQDLPLTASARAHSSLRAGSRPPDQARPLSHSWVQQDRARGRLPRLAVAPKQLEH